MTENPTYRADYEPTPDGSAPHLPEVLGFTETEDLSHIGRKMIEAMHAGRNEEARNWVELYYIGAHAQINQLQDQAYIRAQIGLIVSLGLLRHKGNRVEQARQDLEDAFDYAQNAGYEHEAKIIRTALQALEP